ncbi:hypothetical protein WUBG_13923, partial [Wuchereria bancrofti]
QFEDDQQGTRAALSESMPNILYVQDRGNCSADGRSLMDKDGISTGNDKTEKNWVMNLSEEVETGLINMSPSFSTKHCISGARNNAGKRIGR